MTRMPVVDQCWTRVFRLQYHIVHHMSMFPLSTKSHVKGLLSLVRKKNSALNTHNKCCNDEFNLESMPCIASKQFYSTTLHVMSRLLY